MNTTITSIAVFRISALGDCVLVSAAILSLKRAFPDAKISWIIEESLYPLFSHLEEIEFIQITKPRSFSDYLKLKKLFQHYHFDVLLAMQSSLRANLIYPLINADRKIGFDSTRGREGHRVVVDEQIRFKEEHLLDGFLSFVQYLKPEFDLEPQWDLQVNLDHKSWAEKVLHGLGPNLLVLNPAASKQERSCDSAFYINLLNLCPPFFSAIVLTGGSAHWEVELARQIEEGLKVDIPVKNLVGLTTLPQLLAVIDQAGIFIAPDTGPIHIADALGKKVIGLYAVARPELTGPYLNINWVENCYPVALKQLYDKQPSEVAWSFRLHHPLAMSFFDVEQVRLKIERVLQ